MPALMRRWTSWTMMQLSLVKWRLVTAVEVVMREAAATAVAVPLKKKKANVSDWIVLFFAHWQSTQCYMIFVLFLLIPLCASHVACFVSWSTCTALVLDWRRIKSPNSTVQVLAFVPVCDDCVKSGVLGGGGGGGDCWVHTSLVSEGYMSYKPVLCISPSPIPAYRHISPGLCTRHYGRQQHILFNVFVMALGDAVVADEIRNNHF